MAEEDKAAAAFGLVLVRDSSAGLPELWPEHVPAMRLFEAMQTQWVVGPAGPIGLNYEALPVVEKRLGLSKRDLRVTFAHLQTMEVEALKWFGEKAAER